MTGTVLVVDDSPVIRSQVTKVLETAGFAVVTAENGAEAVDTISEMGAQLGCVFCDLRMPKMDGLEVLRWKAESQWRSIPIVMLTTEGSPGSIAEARALGAKGWVVKPFNEAMLVGCAKKLCAPSLFRQQA